MMSTAPENNAHVSNHGTFGDGVVTEGVPTSLEARGWGHLAKVGRKRQHRELRTNKRHLNFVRSRGEQKLSQRATSCAVQYPGLDELLADRLGIKAPRNAHTNRLASVASGQPLFSGNRHLPGNG